MKLTIVVPVYNVEDTLDRCLASIVRQTFADFELILVDDGSPDQCPQMCDEWAERDTRIKVIHQPNSGLSCARNAGIEMAAGDYITFVDSDDYLAEDTYEHVLPLLQVNDIVEFPVNWHTGAKEQQLRSFGNLRYTSMKDYWLGGQAYTHTYAWNKVFHRKLFDGVRFPQGKVFEDVAILPLLLQQANSVVTTTQGCYYYCCNSRGITATATGTELSMLLDSHMKVIGKWCDDSYYLHVLNIQMDVAELTGCAPTLSRQWVNPLHPGLPPVQRLKACAVNLLGVKGICKINQWIHKTIGRRS